MISPCDCEIPPLTSASKAIYLSNFKFSRIQNSQKFSYLCTTHHFLPFVLEISSAFGPEALATLSDIGRLIKAEHSIDFGHSTCSGQCFYLDVGDFIVVYSICKEAGVLFLLLELSHFWHHVYTMIIMAASSEFKMVSYESQPCLVSTYCIS